MGHSSQRFWKDLLFVSFFCQLCEMKSLKNPKDHFIFRNSETMTRKSPHFENYLKLQMKMGLDYFFEQFPRYLMPMQVESERFGPKPKQDKYVRNPN